MPNIKVEIPKFDTFKALKKKSIVRKLDRRVELYEQMKDMKAELDTLNEDLFPDLRTALPPDVKSFDYKGHQITPMQSGARKSVSVQKLTETPFECPSCGDEITLPVDVVEEAKVEGKQPKPTVSVKRIGEKDGDE